MCNTPVRVAIRHRQRSGVLSCLTQEVRLDRLRCLGDSMRLWHHLLISVFLVALSCALWAQSTAQIQGSIQDASGSAVPGANVKATQTETGAVRATISDADGTYVLANLPIGPYQLEISKPAFSTYVRTGIVLEVESRPTLDIALSVGNVNEQIEVQGGATLVET